MRVFDDAGNVTDEKTQSKIDASAGQLFHFARFEANRERDCAIFKEVQALANMGQYGSVE